jgi:hypothetical protein
MTANFKRPARGKLMAAVALPAVLSKEAKQ